MSNGEWGGTDLPLKPIGMALTVAAALPSYSLADTDSPVMVTGFLFTVRVISPAAVL